MHLSVSACPFAINLGVLVNRSDGLMSVETNGFKVS
tara:strand:- start:22 stop:129 length:108 start_codon:yes stop_codon:yes gene_type:complete